MACARVNLPPSFSPAVGNKTKLDTVNTLYLFSHIAHRRVRPVLCQIRKYPSIFLPAMSTRSFS